MQHVGRGRVGGRQSFGKPLDRAVVRHAEPYVRALVLRFSDEPDEPDEADEAVRVGRHALPFGHRMRREADGGHRRPG